MQIGNSTIIVNLYREHETGSSWVLPCIKVDGLFYYFSERAAIKTTTDRLTLSHDGDRALEQARKLYGPLADYVEFNLIGV